jgi:hypothetical protein
MGKKSYSKEDSQSAEAGTYHGIVQGQCYAMSNYK